MNHEWKDGRFLQPRQAPCPRGLACAESGKVEVEGEELARTGREKASCFFPG